MEAVNYDIFKTNWGWFCLLGGEKGLIRTYLPVLQKDIIRNRILADFPESITSKTEFSMLKTRIIHYYQGQPVDFSTVGVQLDGFSGFQQRVLLVLKTITYGQKISYGELAKLSDSPKAARAIGSVMAKNPLPLVIPCHRVIKADGTLGRFSAPGGAAAKKRMLELEKQE
ncbi:MAG: methylated-DNA--[protein]-cysteine S-methyltransferase [Planctomycetota bacterium]|jgi:methylated-DNA-[protein]-cysteine S-methyltransferase